jgi:hypothetical protein
MCKKSKTFNFSETSGAFCASVPTQAESKKSEGYFFEEV